MSQVARYMPLDDPDPEPSATPAAAAREEQVRAAQRGAGKEPPAPCSRFLKGPWRPGSTTENRGRRIGSSSACACDL